MDALGRTGAGLASAAENACCLSTEPVSLSAERIYHDYAPRVYNVARRMVRSDADAEDVTQDVLLKVLRKLPTFRGESALPTWLHRVTVNTALSHRRKRAVREERRRAIRSTRFSPTRRRPMPVGTARRRLKRGCSAWRHAL